MKRSILLLSLVIILVMVPLLTIKETDFGGADSKAKAAISEIQPNYKAWFTNIWEPPGRETESLLFALQAAIGAGFIGYFIGSMHQKKKQSNSPEKEDQTSDAAH
ncbi:energy-coupling factor ABC transporter substrate-binding protein [Bacillus sp. T3]|uniref:energy-coupling factor ABC transporter substrate-binding protein n=1 Tax=Bacillus sp. T3 TaxID=467262 RepID=UPI0029826AFD|nr:energy-coupling factor ABC transporter substrate-binding protein [Bacillus sp. T3]